MLILLYVLLYPQFNISLINKYVNFTLSGVSLFPVCTKIHVTFHFLVMWLQNFLCQSILNNLTSFLEATCQQCTQEFIVSNCIPLACFVFFSLISSKQTFFLSITHSNNKNYLKITFWKIDPDRHESILYLGE